MTDALPMDDRPDTAPGPMTDLAPAPVDVPPPALPSPLPIAVPAAAPQPAPDTEQLTCPECGLVATVTVNRRDSADFCRNCDYPLFWTPSRVLRDRTDISDESLRRLPGTVGRATIAAVYCPHCAEPNAVSATVCVRCGQPLHPVAALPPPPPPAPVYIPPPAPLPVEPERGVPWWVWALIGTAAVAVVVVVILILTGVIG